MLYFLYSESWDLCLTHKIQQSIQEQRIIFTIFLTNLIVFNEKNSNGYIEVLLLEVDVEVGRCIYVGDKVDDGWWHTRSSEGVE